MPGLGEILIIAAVIVLIFGAPRLPQLGDALGRSIRNFKKAVRGDEIDVTPPRPTQEIPAARPNKQVPPGED